MLMRYQNNSPPTNDDEWKNNGVTKTWDRLMLQVRSVVPGVIAPGVITCTSEWVATQMWVCYQVLG